MSAPTLPTPFMIKLKSDMMQKKKVAESTALSYIANLVRLNKGSFSSLTFLKKQRDEILEHIAKFAPSTESGYLSAITTALYTIKDSHLYTTTYNLYRDLLNSKLDDQDKFEDENDGKKSEKEQENWMTMDEIKDIWKSLEDKVNEFKDSKSLTKMQFETIVDFLILSLYTLVPPRRNLDFLNAYIITKEVPEAHLVNDYNYIDLPNHEMIFNRYKSAKWHGTQKVDIPDELMNVLQLWVKHHPGMKTNGRKPAMIKLFVNHNNEPKTTVNFITLKLKKIFGGRKIGSSMLRHIFISEEFGEEFQKMAKVAEEMGHTVSEQRDYARKD